MAMQGKKKSPSLLRMLAALRRSSLFPAGLLMGAALLGTGGVMLLLPFVRERDALSVEDLTVSIFGCAAIAVGILFVVTTTLWQLAHELLLRLDDDYKHVFGPEAQEWQERTIPKSAEDGTRLDSHSRSKLRRLSTRSLTSGWRLLVMVPLALGGLLLVLSISAWQVPSVGNLVCQRGVRLEYLCLAGLVLMMIGACLMPLGGMVCGRVSKQDRMPP